MASPVTAARGKQREVAALLVLTGMLACSDIRSKTYSFGTLEEARAAGAVAGDLLPEGLPPGSREIRVAHVPDTDERWGIVNFPVGERAALERLLADEIDFTGQDVRIPARIEWWPVALRGTLDAERVRATGLRGYRTRDGRRIVAVNWNQGRVYYWPAR